MTGSILQIVMAVLPYVLQVLGFLMHVQGAENVKAVKATAQYDPLTANLYGTYQKLAGDVALLVGTGLHAVNAHRLAKGAGIVTPHGPSAPVVRPIAVSGNSPVVLAIATLQSEIQKEHDDTIAKAQAEFEKASTAATQLATNQFQKVGELLSQRKIGP